MAKKIEMLNDQQEVVHPLTSSDCVVMENGKTLEEVMGDGIATPTVTHEGASFQVGVGDSNIEVVDGDVAGMTLEGQTYQNILPKPTTLIMETDEKEFKINDKIDNNIVLDDNVAEIATIKGQTYVNVVQEESATEYTVLGEELSGQSITTTNKPEGVIKNATLEGMTLVNTIQEPSEANSVVLDLDADINAQSATIDNTVQGGIKSAILKGNTLVNHINRMYEIQCEAGGYERFTIMSGKTLPAGTYILLYNVIKTGGEATTESGDRNTPYYTKVDGTKIYQGWENHNSTTGKKYWVFTSDQAIETMTYWCAYKSEEVHVKDFVLLTYQEGMENWDIPFFEGMTSVKAPVLKTTGKNLVNTGIFGCKQSDGTLKPNYVPTDTTKGVIVLKPNTTYVLSATYNNSNTSNSQMYFPRIRDNNGNYILNKVIKSALTNYSSAFTTTNEINYVIDVSSNNGDSKGIYVITSIQIEEGSAATPYEPYKSNILTVNEPVELRGIGEVQDTLDCLTGELTQRIGEIVLDGVSIIPRVNRMVNQNNTIAFDFTESFSSLDPSSIHSLNDTFPDYSGDDLYVNDVEGLARGWNAISVRINKDRLAQADAEGFKQWLQSNPITVQCQLTTESVKTVDLSIVDQDNNPIKSIQTHPTLTHVSTSSQGLIPNIVIPSQLKYPTIIKPSTTYTVQLKHTTVNSEFPLTINLGGTVMAVPSTKFTITTPSELTSQDVIFTGKNNVIGEVVITEGDTTGIEYRFFEGMNDVKSPKLLATGKNLFNKTDDLIRGKFVNGINGSDGVNPDYFVSNFIPISNNTSYKVSGNTFGYVGGTVGMATYDINKNFVSASNSTIISTGSNSYYIRVSVHLNDLETFQLEQGSTATSYEPYKGVTIEQSIDSIPLTSDMFEQNSYITSSAIKGMSLQQIPTTTNKTNRIRSKTLIKVKPNATYQTLSSDIAYSGVAYFDKNGAYIGVVAVKTNNEFKTDSNTHYVALNVKKSDDSNITPSSLDSLNLTLQEVPQEIVLRSLPNGVKDTLNLTTGEYVQRIGEVVLDGNSENWVVGSYTEIPFHIQGELPNNCIDEIDSTKILSSYNKQIFQNSSYGSVSATLYYRIRGIVFCPPEGITTREQAIEYIQSNPITVQYELATPIIKKVNLTNTTKLPSYASTTHYDTIVPSNSLVPNIKIPSTIDYNVAIKPSTQYTIRANTTSTMSVNLGGSVGTLANGKVTLTTPSTLAHNSLKLGNGKAKEVMVIEGSEIKDNVPFFNGMKNVQMGGIKLVNIARGATCNSKVVANSNNTQFTFTDDGSSWGYVNFDGSLLKPNTQYTVYMNIITNTSGHDKPIKFECGSHNDAQNYCDVSKGFVGIYKQTITLNENISKNQFNLAFRAYASGGQVTVQNPMIIEGDWTHLDEIPYIESEMIIEQPIIRSQGKNLFDVNKLVQDTNGSNFNSGGYRFPLINFEVGKTYTISVSESKWIKIGEFSAGVTIVENFNTTKLTITITNDLLKSYIMVNNSDCSVITDVEWLRNNIQIEEGSTATSYEPFKHQTLYSNRVIGYEQGIHYGYSDGTKYTNNDYNSILADVEGLSIAYVTNGASNFTFWDKDNIFISGKLYLDTSLSSYYKNGFIAVPSNAKYMRFASEVANYVTDAYTKATVTGELPLRSLPNGVCDSFNLVTGEYVQRVGEVILNGSEVWGLNNTNSKTTCYHLAKGHNSQLLSNMKFNTNSMLCNRYAQITQGAPNLSNNEGIFALSSYDAIYINSNIMSTSGSNDFKQYLSKNPITVQYELETPIVRKIGLTAKGNYKEVELNGSENWNNYNRVTGLINTVGYLTSISDSLNLGETEIYNVFAEEPFSNIASIYSTDAEGCNFKLGNLRVSVKKSRLDEVSSTGFKRYVSLNPFKIGYTSTAQSATSYSNILKPIFFNNVKVQFMNDNLGIQPTLTLQSRTRNSYVMDMMKANTVYTLKALANPKSFTIDGTSYNATTNGTFTSPSTLTNKLMITGQDVQELMIIEGDVTGLTIPYYKGIRSAYDNVDEIEIYSVGKNLFNINGDINEKYSNVVGNFKNELLDDGGLKANNWTSSHHGRGQILKLKPNTTYTITGTVKNHGAITIHSKTKNNLLYHSYNDTSFVDKYTTKSDETELCFCFVTQGGENKEKAIFYNIQIEESSTATPYQLHKENSTIINMSTQLETVEVVKINMVKDMEIGAINHDTGANMDSSTVVRTKNYIPVQPSMHIIYCNNGVERATHFMYYDINKNFIGVRVYESGVTSKGTVTTPDNCYFIRLYHGVTNVDNLTITKKQYKPIALNELPNGVKDELIINRATSSAKLIQRVGKVVLDGSESWTVGRDNQSDVIVFKTSRPIDCISTRNSSIICNLLPNTSPYYDNVAGICFYSGNGNVMVGVRKNETVDTFKQWLKRNPLTVYYELAEPVVTEISLKGYPYAYKDGSVQLNTEIPHTTKVKYNVNQEHLINGQNETIIRHDKQIDNLYDYIELYLEEEYRMELFRMQLELSL